MIDYYLHGATLALFWFLAINVALSFGVMALARAPRPSASGALVLRLLPATAAAFFAAAIFLPSYWKFEPRQSAEGLDVTMTLAALCAVALVLAAALEGARAWWRAARRARTWMASAEPVSFHGVAIPAFRVDAAHPILALAGVFRSRLIVTSGLLEALTPEELSACVAHELGHHRGWDNLKRLAMRCSPDVLRWSFAAPMLEDRWVAAAEHRADEAIAPGAGEGRAARLALASALVKVARRSPSPVPRAEPICTLVGSGDIVSRVHQLVEEDPHRGRARSSGRAWILAAGVFALVVAYAPLLAVVHDASEALVHFLP